MVLLSIIYNSDLCPRIIQSGKLEDAIEKLLVLEKQTRNVSAIFRFMIGFPDFKLGFRSGFHHPSCQRDLPTEL